MSIKVKPENTIQDVKIIIADNEGINFELQRLIFAGTDLEGDKTL